MLLEKKQKFNEFIENNLNKTQLQAVQQQNGPLLVIAGAGSGKTRIITSRIANLILNENEPSDSIIALTFTNKAAQEMKDRINLWLSSDQQLPFIGTFHSFCLRILKLNRNLLEIPDFVIFDDDDQYKLIQTIIQKFGLNKKVNAKQIQFCISSIKNNLALEQTNLFSENKINQEIYLEYEKERKLCKSLDFDDLIIETVKLFKTNKEFKKRFQNQTKHILIDEYQDTSTIQHALLKYMAQNEEKNFALRSLCIVGDEDQSIYSWRGAAVQNIVHFNKEFINTKTIKIEQNYRSVQPILETANKIISNNKNRNPKKLWSDRPAKNRILHITCASEYKEGEMIAQAIKSIEQAKKPLNSIVVLYRTHFQSRAIEEALIKNSIPYTIFGGIQFYERKEIKDIIAYLKLAINKSDRISFFRIINCPARKLGDKFEEDFYLNWSNEPFLNFIDIANKIIEEKKLTKIKEDSLLSFIKIYENLPKENLVQAIQYIIDETNYIGYLKTSFEKVEAESKIENIKEFLRAAYHFSEQGTNTITTFLEEIALMQQKISKQNESDNKVQLMTLHAAKGLEFDTVIISGLEEGLLPSKKTLLMEEEIEEERRLFYVGITRAKEYLILSNVKYRNSFGQTNIQTQSRFLDEMQISLIQKEDLSNYSANYQCLNIFSNFFGSKLITTEVLTFGNNIQSKPNLKKEIKFKPSQPVKHKEFGIGIIEKVENKDNGRIFATIKFKKEIKKIDISFLEKI